MNLSKIIKIYNSKCEEEEFDALDVNDKMIVETIIYGIFDACASWMGKELDKSNNVECYTNHLNFRAEKRRSEEGEENVAVFFHMDKDFMED